MRRYVRLEPSRGTVIPVAMRYEVRQRDGFRCVGFIIGMPGQCHGTTELDHVRASHAIQKKSRTEPDNLVSLCAIHHRMKTEEGRTWRPKLLDYLARFDSPTTARRPARCADEP